MANYGTPLIAVGFALAAFFAAPAAMAHAHLQQQSPAADAVSPKGIDALTLSFSEGIEPALSRVTLSDDRGSVIPTAPATLASGHSRTLVVALKSPLEPGRYFVQWQVVSVDSHKTQGEYRFSVK